MKQPQKFRIFGSCHPNIELFRILETPELLFSLLFHSHRTWLEVWSASQPGNGRKLNSFIRQQDACFSGWSTCSNSGGRYGVCDGAVISNAAVLWEKGAACFAFRHGFLLTQKENAVGKERLGRVTLKNEKGDRKRGKERRKVKGKMEKEKVKITKK